MKSLAQSQDEFNLLTVHEPTSNERRNLRRARIRTQGCWVRGATATYFLLRNKQFEQISLEKENQKVLKIVHCGGRLSLGSQQESAEWRPDSSSRKRFFLWKERRKRKFERINRNFLEAHKRRQEMNSAERRRPGTDSMKIGRACDYNYKYFNF